MKRALLILTALLWLIPMRLTAQEELHWISPTIGGNDAVMIVNNGSDWQTRLNLRAEQRKGSEIRGRIYTGTRVELYQDNGQWCTVGLRFGHGHVLTGEVMKEYLSPIDDGFSALCPLAIAKEEIVLRNTRENTLLQAGDCAYVLAVCGEEYFVLTKDGEQGYASADAFEPLKEPELDERLRYGAFRVPAGGITFCDELTGEMVSLAGGVVLEDCWRFPDETQWHVTFGAGIQRMVRVEGIIPEDQLTEKKWAPFEGEVYALDKSFIIRMGAVNGQPILKRMDPNGDIFWALGDVPEGAVQFDSDLCVIDCETEEMLSQPVINSIMTYVDKHRPLDERGGGNSVSAEVIARCTLRASLIYDATAEQLIVRAWLEDADGTYVTGGDLEPGTGTIVRWGCNG